MKYSMHYAFPLVLALLSVNAVSAQPPGSSSPEESAATDTQQSPAEVEAINLAPAQEAGTSSSATPGPDAAADAKLAPGELPEGYEEELERRVGAFRELRSMLAERLVEQREIQILYLNGEKNTPADRDAFYAKRAQVRNLMDEVYLAALNIIRIGMDEEAATYAMTMIQNRFEHDIYDVPTLEGAARLIDGGSKLTYLFQAAARSAVVAGDFELAQKLFDSIDEDQMVEIDQTLEFHLDEYRAAFEKEAAIRAKEEEEDRLPRVKLNTNQGDVIVELFIDQAPTTASNFIRLVEEGFYDGNDFLQVIDHLLALTGDPTGTGDGNSGKYLADEHDRPDARSAFRGSLVMAKLPMGESGSFVPNSASSQFAILFLPMISVSEQQTVFGRVIEGMDAIGRLRRVDPSKKKKKGEIQLPPDRIIEATVIRRPEELPTPRTFDHIHYHP